jgi:hypothetical protein
LMIVQSGLGLKETWLFVSSQWRCRHPLWVAEHQEEILCLCASHFDLLPILVQVCSCF